MYCIRCGKQLEDGTQYCIYCGAPTVAAKKERPQPADDDISIPVDFFSSHMMADSDTDDFTIRIPNDFVKIDDAMRQVRAEEADETRRIPQDELREAIAEQREQPDAAGEADYTRMISKDDLREAIAEQRAQPAEEQPELPVRDIPDIPIPSDFIEEEAAEPVQTEEDDDAPEQLMSRRGIIFVIMVVVLLFAIAVGACVAALRGTSSADAGSGSAAEVGFWSGDENG